MPIETQVDEGEMRAMLLQARKHQSHLKLMEKRKDHLREPLE